MNNLYVIPFLLMARCVLNIHSSQTTKRDLFKSILYSKANIRLLIEKSKVRSFVEFCRLFTN